MQAANNASCQNKAVARAVYATRDANEDADFAVGSKEEEAAARAMQSAIRATPGHLFNKDEHRACGSSCPAKKGNSCYDPKHVPHGLSRYIAPGAGDVLYDAVTAVFNTYSELAYCKKLMYPGSTNLCESRNSLSCG